MQSFTGPELGAMLEDGCVIGAHDAFSEELENKLEEMPEMFARITSYDHWVRSAYLITSVTEDDGKTKVQLDDARELDAFRSRLSETLQEVPPNDAPGTPKAGQDSKNAPQKPPQDNQNDP